ncbi:hypothetical protein L2729_03160 [Shewanella gelidimarina]|uniref:hypothetical protein n=1 Tax=Shewanella gelidimarina TaxID=56813 RepID=UPI00200EF004|nr:hypothetical protein [Shewanella gelidimarina]MCL1056992.1 hypothetical protein [Shewanella gelidimarina]
MQNAVVIAILFTMSWLMMSNASARVVVSAISQSWPLTLLESGLKRVDSQYQAKVMTIEMKQKRKVKESLAGNIDVLWNMTSAELKEQILPKKTSIFKDLLSHRLLIIGKQPQADFNIVANTSGFVAFIIGQNYYWPDADIISAASLPIVTTYKNKHLSPMLGGS